MESFSVADPGFPEGGRRPRKGGGTKVWRGYVLEN